MNQCQEWCSGEQTMDQGWSDKGRERESDGQEEREMKRRKFGPNECISFWSGFSAFCIFFPQLLSRILNIHSIDTCIHWCVHWSSNCNFKMVLNFFPQRRVSILHVNEKVRQFLLPFWWSPWPVTFWIEPFRLQFSFSAPTSISFPSYCRFCFKISSCQFLSILNVDGRKRERG